MNKGKKILLFVILFIGMFVFSYIPLELFHINLDSLDKKIQLLYDMVCSIIYVIIVLLIYRKRIIDEFKDYRKHFKKYLKISIIYYFIGFTLMYISNSLITVFFSEATPNNDVAIKNFLDMYPIYMLFTTLIHAPIVEETIFRRSFKDVVLAFGNNKFTKYIYIIIGGLLFASMHVIGMVNSNYDYLYIIPYLSLGITFTALYYKTDNLFTTITLHTLHNLLAILIYCVTGV